MAVRSGLLIDRAQKIKHHDDALWTQVEMLGYECFEFLVVDLARSKGGDHDRSGFGHANGVADLYLATRSQARRHYVLGHITRRVSRRTINLGRVLAGERATAMRRGTTVCIDNDLAPGQTAVALRAADHETSGRIDQVANVLGNHVLG